MELTKNLGIGAKMSLWVGSLLVLAAAIAIVAYIHPSYSNFLITALLALNIAIGAMAVSFVNKSISAPIKKLAQQTDAISKGNLDVKLGGSNIEELQSLIRALDRVTVCMRLAVLRAGVARKSLIVEKAVEEAREDVPESFNNVEKVTDDGGETSAANN